jgi:hypothetical protein
MLQASQVLRLNSIWGGDSLVFPDSVTDWSSAGWMCRIYLTISLGILQPLLTFTTLLMFAAGVR